MDIFIRLDQAEPPSGDIRSADDVARPGRPFEGWLALIGALYEVLGSATSAQGSVISLEPPVAPERVAPGPEDGALS